MTEKTRMLSAILLGLQDLRLVEEPVPDTKPQNVLLKVTACGVCPTDLKKYYTIYGGQLSLPQNLGHEYVGTVEKVGSAANNFEMGTRVVGFGFGGFAEYALLDLSLNPNIHIPTPLIVSDSVDDTIATFVEPIACCIHALQDQLCLSEHDSILIIGAGTMGLLLLMIAKHMGCKVITSEPHHARRNQALSMGADAVIDPQSEDLKSAVFSLNNNQLADATILTIGNPASAQDALEATRPCGKVLLFGRFPAGSFIKIDPNQIYRNEIQILGSYILGGKPEYANTRACHIKALQMVVDRLLPVEQLISGIFPLAQIHKAFVASASMETYKIIVKP